MLSVTTDIDYRGKVQYTISKGGKIPLIASRDCDQLEIGVKGGKTFVVDREELEALLEISKGWGNSVIRTESQPSKLQVGYKVTEIEFPEDEGNYSVRLRVMPTDTNYVEIYTQGEDEPVTDMKIDSLIAAAEFFKRYKEQQ